MSIPRALACCVFVIAMSGCGGGGGGGDAGTAPPAVTNVLPVSVEGGPVGGVNLPFTSVTVCIPGTSNCQTIDHVIVDTASTGLRIIGSVLALASSLPQQTDAAGNAVAECAQFASGYSWGAIRIADVRLAGEQAASVPVQVIGDAAFPAIPTSCSSTGPAHNSVQTLLANGILGVGMFREDCGTACATTASIGLYYACPPGGCQPIALPLARQVKNPVALFGTHNNGVVVRLPAIAPTGASSVAGSLVLGIGTHANNALGAATVFPVNPATGTFTTVYRGRVLNRSFVDSGSNGYFFDDAGIPRCQVNSAFYCPGATLPLSATIQGTDGTATTVNFAVADTVALLQNNPGARAFDNLAGPVGSASVFDWGLPFFFGRSVFTAIVGAATPAGAGPYIAF